LSIGRRAATALLGLQTYVVDLVWPHDLAVLYPYPTSIAMWQIVLAAIGFTILTVGALWSLRTRPWLTIGWLWFVGTLVPVSGLVQAGSQPWADRFTYVPFVGLFIIVAWGAAEAAARTRLVAPVVCLAIGVCGFLSRVQLSYWHDGVTLWRHALAV